MNRAMSFLVYIDGSDESLVAMEYAIYLTKSHPGSKLFGSYIMNTNALDELIKSKIFLESERAEYEEDMHHDAKKYLKEFDLLAAKKGVSVTSLQGSGSVHLKIKNFITDYKIDILIVGELAHVRSSRDEFFNEVDRLIRYVPCSVLIAKNERYTHKLYDSL